MRLRIGSMAAAGALLLVPSGASAASHEMKIREVFVDATNPATDSYVVLQMRSSGQNFVQGHTVTIFDASGDSAVEATFPDPGNLDPAVANGQNQATILVSIDPTPNGVAADLLLTDSGLGDPDPNAGAACFDKIDCLAWGAYPDGVLPDDSTGAAAAFAGGQALQRTISPGCETLLEAEDDSGVNSADFSLAAPNPRNNASPITEKSCSGDGGGDDDNPPDLDSYARDVQSPKGNRVAKLKGGCDEACTVRASGTLVITKSSGKKTKLKLISDRKAIKRPTQRNLFMRLSEKDANKMFAALKKDWGVIAIVKVTAKDKAGNKAEDPVRHRITIEKA